ncbi:EDD domain protein, DegV family [Clostridium collagenovorans DSM 3089]|uniref:EDD domain protein, DegV family n=1 Tax=Clostridium collagenovorans DSM 3089 TaxID=1121306 RepID=A0A1M5XYK7_9CLOT|nr:DegV family protein [Clostridium collagenovorans]SHI04917.1 EDD domain protein, DegV family [Clostridium collagenovorans DSM 3089]
MDKIKIITDSTCDLPKEVVEKYDIEVIPLIVNINGESYYDGVNLVFPELVQKMEFSDEFPTTSQINPQRFMEHYKPYLEQGYKILSIHLSSKMSGTYQSSCIAKETLETEDIVTIDSLNVTAGLGILVLKAAMLKEKGLSIEEIECKIKQAIPHVKSSLVFGSLENLVKGGRLSRTTAAIGNLLGIKLIMEVNDGEMKVREKVRGTKKAVKNAFSYMKEKGINKEDPVLFEKTGDKELEELVRNNIKDICENYVEVNVGCVVGVHSGPTASGVFFIEDY